MLHQVDPRVERAGSQPASAPIGGAGSRRPSACCHRRELAGLHPDVRRGRISGLSPGPDPARSIVAGQIRGAYGVFLADGEGRPARADWCGGDSGTALRGKCDVRHVGGEVPQATRLRLRTLRAARDGLF